MTSPEHEWNEVKLDDNWYVVDCTWDDSDIDNSWYYTYFCKSDSAVNEGFHEVESYLENYRPACNSDYIGKIFHIMAILFIVRQMEIFVVMIGMGH